MGNIEWIADIVERRRAATRIRKKAFELLDRNDLNEILELAGTTERTGEASAALKAVLADKITEYTVRAMKEAKRRGTRLGAAAIIIAATKAR